MIVAKSVHPYSGIRAAFFDLVAAGLAGAAIDVHLGVAPFAGELFDLIVGQGIVGVAGTSFSVQIKKQTRGGALVSMLSTEGVLTLAAGDAASVDARKQITAINGCTRPVISSTVATRRFAKGDLLRATITPTGAYTTSPQIALTLALSPDF